MAKKKRQKLDDAFLTTHGVDRFSASRNLREQEVEDQWVDSSDQYDSQFKVGKDKTKSEVLANTDKLFIPKTYTNTQRILVDLLEAFFFDPEEIVSIGSWKGIPSDHKTMVKTLLNWRLNCHPIDFYMEAYEVCLDALKNKVGIMKVFPKFTKGGMKGYVPQMTAIPYEDVFFDASSTWKDYHQKTIIHRMLLPLDHLERQGYKNLDKFEPVQDIAGTDRVKLQRRKDQGESPFDADSNVQSSNNVYVYDIMTHLDVNKDGLLESCNYLMGGDQSGPQFMTRGVEENKLPYKVDGEDYNRPPIVVGSAYPEPHKMYGKDLPQITEGLQREINSQRNQRREAVALGLRPPVLVMRGSGIDLMSLVNRRIGAVVMGNDVSPSSIREMDVQDATAGSYRESATTDQDFMEATSVPPNLLGVSAPGEQSATESVQQDTNANKKIAMIIKNMRQTCFLPAFRMLLRLEKTYVTDKTLDLVAGRIIGKKLMTRNTETGELTPIKNKKSIIEGDFELKANVGINKQAQLNKWFLLMDRANQSNASTANMVSLGVIDPTKAKFIDVAKFYELALAVLGEKDIDEFTVEAQQPPPVEQGAGAPGQASQPGLPGGAPIQAVSNMNPGGL